MNRRFGKCLIYILFFSIVSRAGAQAGYQPIADRFLEFYNQQLSDSIFFMYSPEFRQRLPLEKNRVVVEGLHVEYGDLRSLNIISQDSGYARCSARFSAQILELVLAMSPDALIEGFRFIPYSAVPKADSQKEIH